MIQTKMDRYIVTEIMMRTDPVWLFEKHLQYETGNPNAKAFDWQIELINGDWTDALLLMCRQIGKSTIMSFLALKEAFLNDGAYIPFITRSKDQSLKNMRKVNKMWRFFTGTPPTGRVRLELPNGSTIEALPNNEETVRGSTSSLILLDESSRIPDTLYQAVRPFRARMKGGRLIAATTPNGKQGWFYNQWTRAKHWKKFGPLTWEDAGLSFDFIEKEMESMPNEIFRQEYLCEFLSTTNAVFKDGDLDKISKGDLEVIKLNLEAHV